MGCGMAMTVITLEQGLWQGYDGDNNGTGVVAWLWWELGDSDGLGHGSDGRKVVAW